MFGAALGVMLMLGAGLAMRGEMEEAVRLCTKIRFERCGEVDVMPCWSCGGLGSGPEFSWEMEWTKADEGRVVAWW